MQENDPFDWNEAYSGDASDYAEPDSGLIEIIDGLRPGRALDIGCGAGGLVVALAERKWQVTGVDIAAKAIEAARKIGRRRVTPYGALFRRPPSGPDVRLSPHPALQCRYKAVVLWLGGRLELADCQVSAPCSERVTSNWESDLGDLTGGLVNYGNLSASVVRTVEADFDSDAGQRISRDVLHHAREGVGGRVVIQGESYPVLDSDHANVGCCGVTVSRVTPRSRVIAATPRSTHRQSAPEAGACCTQSWPGVHGQRSVLELPGPPQSEPGPRSW